MQAKELEEIYPNMTSSNSRRPSFETSFASSDDDVIDVDVVDVDDYDESKVPQGNNIPNITFEDVDKFVDLLLN